MESSSGKAERPEVRNRGENNSPAFPCRQDSSSTNRIVQRRQPSHFQASFPPRWPSLTPPLEPPPTSGSRQAPVFSALLLLSGKL